jgi:hypothetical protein
MSFPEGLKETPLPCVPGRVAGFEYFVPKPDDHE